MWFLTWRSFLICLAGFLGLCGVGPLCAATFTVLNAADTGAGSLRAAISNANFSVGTDLIDFALPGTGPFTINLVSVLPSVLEPVAIDGTTQPGYAGLPLISLNGASAAGHGTGIYLLTSNTVVKGLSINRFPRDGIRIENFGGNVIQGNFIGSGPYGTNLLGNGNGADGVAGITIVSRGNRVGGPNAGDRNVISGSNQHGIYLLTTLAVSNVVQGNYIGTDPTGTKRVGNRNNGIALGAGARWNMIGGTNVGEGNLLSGNSQSGVYLIDTSTLGNTVAGNYIGTDVSGTASVSNVSDGITIFSATTNRIASNVISGNGGRGIIITGFGARQNQVKGNFIGTDVSGTSKVPNRLGGVELFNVNSNVVGGLEVADRNVISGNLLSGVSITDSNSTGNVVWGNFIGTDVTGNNRLGNSRSGVFLSGVVSNLIGGGNVISGNTDNGVVITDVRARGNRVQGNLIGINAAGLQRLANGTAGVRLESSRNFIGAADAAARNVISGNSNSGIFIVQASASNNVIQGNFIGTTISGMAALSNGFGGIGLTNAPANLIGGTNTGEGNVISGNNLNAIYLLGRANSNVIQGNFIGTDATGMSALGNGVGLPIADGAGGIDISGATANLIGGRQPGAGNVISGNFRDAIAIGDPGASNNVIQGNLIGVKADGVTALGNEWHGVEIRTTGGGTGTVIGGAEPGAGNVLAYATLAQRSGVRLRSIASNTNILIRGNSIFFNGGGGATGLGIDIGNFGVNPNDNCDADTGGNGEQNYPVLTNALSAGNVTFLQGTLNSKPNTTYLLQFFANPIPEPSGLIEGKIFLGETSVATDGSCNGAFSVFLTNGVGAGQRVTALATDPANNTSEFSAGFAMVAAQLPTFTVQPQSQGVAYASDAAFTASATGTGGVSYQWRFNGTNVPGATTAQLNVSDVQLADRGLYSVTASNAFGVTTSSNALLTVLVTAPSLGIASVNGTLVLRWSASEPQFQLQTTTNLAPPILWTPATNTPVSANGFYEVTLPTTDANRFYRLALP